IAAVLPGARLLLFETADDRHERTGSGSMGALLVALTGDGRPERLIGPEVDVEQQFVELGAAALGICLGELGQIQDELAKFAVPTRHRRLRVPRIHLKDSRLSADQISLVRPIAQYIITGARADGEFIPTAT